MTKPNIHDYASAMRQWLEVRDAWGHDQLDAYLRYVGVARGAKCQVPESPGGECE